MGMEGCLVRTQSKVDVLPEVNAGIATGGCVEIDIDGFCVHTRCIPCDVERAAGRDGLTHGGGFVEATGRTTWIAIRMVRIDVKV